jgi:ppGpp synthetase/RelA/SpoT-type nucleotidyltranferase
VAGKPTPDERARVDPLVKRFEDKKHLVSQFQQSILFALNESKKLPEFVHSIRSRIKDPDHLRDKLVRKLRKSIADGVEFNLTKENLLTKITDLGGIRLLHLHTKQVQEIDKILKEVFAELGDVVEGPFARTWDDESRKFFKGIGFSTQDSETMYTSVHYVVATKSTTKVTCEIQVRTLMEEVWGEVDHTLNYPHPTNSIACKEQILALARSTSAATRLVDSIFATAADLKRKKKRAQQKKAQSNNPLD